MVDGAAKARPNIKGKISVWEELQREHKEKQLINPFSGWQGASHRAKLSKSDKDYGRPVAGSKTEFRGEKANLLISSEVKQLIQVICRHGRRDDETGRICITFGELFEIYTHISNKIVGLLLRARKYELIDFEGEMLFQRRDESTVIYVEATAEQHWAKKEKAYAEISESLT